jgi:hypothetical protein
MTELLCYKDLSLVRYDAQGEETVGCLPFWLVVNHNKNKTPRFVIALLTVLPIKVVDCCFIVTFHDANTGQGFSVDFLVGS